jgi:hypothetical protein
VARKLKWTNAQLAEAVRTSHSVAQVLRKLGLSVAGGTHASVKLRIKLTGLDTSHFTGQGWCTGRKHAVMVGRFVLVPLDEILVRNSTYLCTHHLKHRLLAEGLLENKCAICGIGPEWNGKLLSLNIDHKDGDRTNNLLKNLRIVCPNCHSQTDTFAGKNKAK